MYLDDVSQSVMRELARKEQNGNAGGLGKDSRTL